MQIIKKLPDIKFTNKNKNNNNNRKQPDVSGQDCMGKGTAVSMIPEA